MWMKKNIKFGFSSTKATKVNQDCFSEPYLHSYFVFEDIPEEQKERLSRQYSDRIIMPATEKGIYSVHLSWNCRVKTVYLA